ncbi:MAG: heavy metal translocating P-type ATPase [Geothrix sp.]|uniref:heavy metal translocating P-type ATPase n=1 Tax=Geothrix sp. TaxID=1962974 RepID=UPI001795153A|nr:heavy metal translocating P-type ATPase [Geothrix sp.]NWJ41955.1 heavy metal translocating P-type ATPase [Geothrix sp.]WIL20072.1 MAG: heavy metal translocating P-type ATPase [Geothrix sp.]
MSPGATCDLCGAAATKKPQVQVFRSQEKRFCCTGCLNVYAILLESGAMDAGVDLRSTDLYQESLRLGLLGQGGEAATPAVPEGVETREALYQLSGMWCAACGWVVEHALRRERGVVSAEVLFTSDLLKVTYCPQLVPPGVVPDRVKSLGYKAAEFGTEQEGDRREWQDMLLRLGIAGGLWMNVMLFSLVIYASYFEGIAGWAQRAVPFILMALTLPVVLYSAWPIHRIAWYGVKSGHLRMEALISTGVLAAFAYSSAQAVLGGRHFYFDTACAIVTLVLTGKALERNAKDRSARAIAMLHRLLPRKARLRIDGQERFVAIEALEADALILVKPGERIPADGVVVEGQSAVDESVVTGESDPQAKAMGDAVICGSLNTAGVLEIRVTRCGEDSTLAQIVKSVQAALAGKSPLERMVDRVSRLFIPVVLALAALTVLVCLSRGLTGTEAMLRGIAVLVIACPCALGIATPLATTAAIGAASRQGIIIRDVRVLETFRKVDLLILDKTGTVTEGDFRVRHAELEGLDLVAALESYSEHPLAHAVGRHAADLGIGRLDASGIEVRAGRGLLGTVAGKRVVVGNRRLLAEEGLALSADLEARASAWEAEGLTVAFAAVDGLSTGALAFGDRPRAEAAAVIAELRARGVRVVLLSGDARTTTERIAMAVGVDDFLGEVSPSEKAEAVRRFQAQGKVVAMVGDGINDAPALAAADLGIAMGSGADLAMHAAPVVLMRDSLTRITKVFRLATLTLRVLKQNLFWAFVYNTAGISLAMTGVLNPILAAGAMVLSSLSVIGNSMRLGRDRA